MAVEDEFCTLNELADRMSAAVVERYAMPHGTVLTCRFSDGDVLSMDASENIRIVARQNAVLEIFRQIEQGEILVLNASFMPAARPIKYSDFDRRIIPREQADNIVRSIAGVPEPKSEVTTQTELPALRAIAEQATEPASPLTTTEIAIVFAGIVFPQHRWVPTLNSAKWVKSARLKAGTPGVKGAALWNPVDVALLLATKKSVPSNQQRILEKLSIRFRNQALLHPWQTLWENRSDHLLDA